MKVSDALHRRTYFSQFHVFSYWCNSCKHLWQIVHMMEDLIVTDNIEAEVSVGARVDSRLNAIYNTWCACIAHLLCFCTDSCHYGFPVSLLFQLLRCLSEIEAAERQLSLQLSIASSRCSKPSIISKLLDRVEYLRAGVEEIENRVKVCREM